MRIHRSLGVALSLALLAPGLAHAGPALQRAKNLLAAHVQPGRTQASEVILSNNKVIDSGGTIGSVSTPRYDKIGAWIGNTRRTFEIRRRQGDQIITLREPRLLAVEVREGTRSRFYRASKRERSIP